MKTRKLTFASTVMLLVWAEPALADAVDARLTRAVAAKELAMDDPAPSKWQLAFERFLEADAIEPSAETKYELGFIAAQLHHKDLAVEHYEASLGFGLTGPARGKAESYVMTHGSSLARLHVRGPGGSRVRIRGIERGRLPLARPLVVLAGDAHVEITDPSGMTTTHRTISLEPGRIGEIDWVANDSPRVVPTLGSPPVQPQSAQRSRADLSNADLSVLASESSTAETYTEKTVGGRTAGRWLIGSGIGVVVSSAMMVAISMSKLSEKRGQMRDACEVPLPGSVDGCDHASPGRYDDALGIADDIARWRTVQGAAWVGVGVGALGTAVGWAILSRKSRDAQTAAHWSLTPTVGQRTALATWRLAF